MTGERYLHVGLHAADEQAAAEVRARAGEADLYEAFVVASEAAGLSWSRLDRPSPRPVAWGMNDAGFGDSGTELAWVQVTPTVASSARFPLLDATLMLHRALTSVRDADVAGVHVVTAVDEFRNRSASAAIESLASLTGDGTQSTMVIEVDVFTRADGIDSAIQPLVQRGVAVPTSVTVVNHPGARRDSGCWRLSSDPAVRTTSPIRSLHIEATTATSQACGPLFAEALLAGLAVAGCDGPAYVSVRK